MADRPLSLEVFAVDRTLIAAEEVHSFVHLRVRAVEPPGRRRPRLTAVLVLDVSGSMGGEPIARVAQSAARLAEILGDDDALGIVSFADGADVVTPIRPLDAAARRAIAVAVGTLRAGGQTNLAGGLAQAGLLLPPRPPGERQLALVLSDGFPNVGASTVEALAEQAGLLKVRDVAVSTLGFGAEHNDDILQAVADAGGGRYAFVDDPRLAAPSFARALGAQRDVVAEQVRVVLTPSEGVEIERVLGSPRTTVSAAGLAVPLADAIAGDELNLVVALRLRPPRERGPWRGLQITLEARSAPGGEPLRIRDELAVTLIGAGPREQNEPTLAAVAIALCDEHRTEARGLADRGDYPGAAAVLRRARQMILGTPGYDPAASSPSPLHDAAETLLDEIAAYEKMPDRERYQQFRKASRGYADLVQGGSRPSGTQVGRSVTSQQLVEKLLGGHFRPAFLVEVDGPAAGRRHPLGPDVVVGRAPFNEIPVADPRVSRRHARFVCDADGWWVVDLGSSSGTLVNGCAVDRHRLAPGDIVALGGVRLRFEDA